MIEIFMFIVTFHFQLR